MPRTNLWFNTHTKRYDFHPEIFKLQKKCPKCKFPPVSFEDMEGKEILQHYYQKHQMYTIIVCDVCGLPFEAKKEVQAHKYEVHSH